MSKNIELSNLVKLSNEDFANLSWQIFMSSCKDDDWILFPYLQKVDTALNATTLDRKCYIYDPNPLAKMLYEAHFFYPSLNGIRNRLREIPIYDNCPNTPIKKYFNDYVYHQIVSLKLYLQKNQHDPTNMWIANLCALAIKEYLKREKERKNENAQEETQECEDRFNVKGYIVEAYKHIYSNLDIDRVLISHFCRPTFEQNPNNLDSIIKNGTISLAYYSPYELDITKYHKKNIFSMWLYGIQSDALKMAFPKDKQEWNHRCKKDFDYIHKKLKSSGLILVDKNPNDIPKFMQMATIYGYKNIRSFVNEEDKTCFLLKKL